MGAQKKDFLNLIPGQYCFQCHSPKVEEKVDDQNRVFYQCPVCSSKNSRVLEIDPKIKLQKTKQGWQHFTVGALIVDNFENPNRYLIIKKRKHPYLYDFVAGHIEKGEKTEDALVREVKEEAGGMIKQKKLLLKILINPDPCRRGVNIHQWFLYLCSLKNKIQLSQDEVAGAGWYSKKELQDLNFVIPAKKMLKILKLVN